MVYFVIYYQYAIPVEKLPWFERVLYRILCPWGKIVVKHDSNTLSYDGTADELNALIDREELFGVVDSGQRVVIYRSNIIQMIQLSNEDYLRVLKSAE